MANKKVYNKAKFAALANNIERLVLVEYVSDLADKSKYVDVSDLNIDFENGYPVLKDKQIDVRRVNDNWVTDPKVNVTEAIAQAYYRALDAYKK